VRAAASAPARNRDFEAVNKELQQEMLVKKQGDLWRGGDAQGENKRPPEHLCRPPWHQWVWGCFTDTVSPTGLLDPNYGG